LAFVLVIYECDSNKLNVEIMSLLAMLMELIILTLERIVQSWHTH